MTSHGFLPGKDRARARPGSITVRRDRFCNTLDLGFERQPRHFKQYHAKDWHLPQDRKLAEILVLCNQDQSFFVGDCQYIGVSCASAFLCNRVNREAVEPEPLDDWARDVFVGKESHSYSAASGFLVPTVSAA